MVKITLEDIEDIAANGLDRFTGNKPREGKPTRYLTPQLAKYRATHNPPNVLVNLAGGAASTSEGMHGYTTSDIAWRAAVMKDMIYRQAAELMVGEQLCYVQATPNLDSRWAWPTEVAANYPVDEFARGENYRVEWIEFTNQLYKADVNFILTDEVFIRGQNNIQQQMTMKQASIALAALKDENIISTLISGAGGTAAALDNWDDWDSATRDPVQDLVICLNSMLASSNATLADLRNAKVTFPIEFMPVFMEARIINDTQQSYQQYLKTVFGIDLVPTRTLTASGEAMRDLAMVVIPGMETAIHQILSPAANVPLAEVQRKQSVGYDYTIRQWYNTKVVPESASQTTNERIYTITNIREGA